MQQGNHKKGTSARHRLTSTPTSTNLEPDKPAQKGSTSTSCIATKSTGSLRATVRIGVSRGGVDRRGRHRHSLEEDQDGCWSEPIRANGCNGSYVTHWNVRAASLDRGVDTRYTDCGDVARTAVSFVRLKQAATG